MTGKISEDVDQDFQHARSALFVRVGSDRKRDHHMGVVGWIHAPWLTI